MALPWKKAAKHILGLYRSEHRYRKLYEGLAGRPATMAKELEEARMDAFAGWMSVRILSLSLRKALNEGVFDVETRAALEKDLAKVRIEDPEQYASH